MCIRARSKTPTENNVNNIHNEDPPQQSKIEDFTPADFSDDDLPF